MCVHPHPSISPTHIALTILSYHHCPHPTSPIPGRTTSTALATVSHQPIHTLRTPTGKLSLPGTQLFRQQRTSLPLSHPPLSLPADPYAYAGPQVPLQPQRTYVYASEYISLPHFPIPSPTPHTYPPNSICVITAHRWSGGSPSLVALLPHTQSAPIRHRFEGLFRIDIAWRIYEGSIHSIHRYRSPVLLTPPASPNPFTRHPAPPALSLPYLPANPSQIDVNSQQQQQLRGTEPERPKTSLHSHTRPPNHPNSRASFVEQAQPAHTGGTFVCPTSPPVHLFFPQWPLFLRRLGEIRPSRTCSPPARHRLSAHCPGCCFCPVGCVSRTSTTSVECQTGNERGETAEWIIG